jgi:hypothetical protein
MGILEFTITSCLHLVRSMANDYKPLGVGSGVIVNYRGRFFMCTVAHFSTHPDQNVGLITGRIKNSETEIYYFNGFSYVYKIDFGDFLPDAEDLEFCLSNPDKSGVPLDIAFKEITLLENIHQPKRTLNIEGNTLVINEGGKSMPIVDEHYEIDSEHLCSFYGRIRPDFRERVLHFEEKLYYGLTIKSVSENFIEMDLGSPIRDHSRFKGCSGAPVIDTRGRLIGLVTHGDSDPSKRSIYAFRFDKLKKWIDLMYFNKLPQSNH